MQLLAKGYVVGVRVTRTGREHGSRVLTPAIQEALQPVRVTTAFKRLLRLEDVNVVDVTFFPALILVTVALRRRRLLCPHCGFKTSARYDTRDRPSRWWHLDLGVWRVEIAATLRRLRCPTHGVVVEAVPFARPGAHLTRERDRAAAAIMGRVLEPRPTASAALEAAPVTRAKRTACRK